MRIVIAALIVMLFGSSGFSFAESVTLQLKWKHKFQFAGYYAAEMKGYYAERGFEVSILARQAGKAPLQQLADGEVEFAVSDASVVLARLKGEQVVVVTTVFQHSPLVLITLAESGINSPYQLIQKPIMYQGGIDDAVLQAMFYKLDISPDQIVQVPHNFDEYALLNSDIVAMSAYSSNQPYLYDQMGISINVIDPANYGIDFYGDLLVTSESLVKNAPERVQAFKDATLKGWQYALDNPEEVVSYIIDKYGDESQRSALLWEAEKTKLAINPSIIPIGTEVKERFEYMATIYKQLGYVDTVTGVDRLLFSDFIEANDDVARSVRLLLLALLALIVVSLVLAAVIQKLRRVVAEKGAELKRYLAVLDKQVLSSRSDVNGRLISVSQKYLDLCGYTLDELLGQSYAFLRHPDIEPEIIEQLERLIAEQGSWSGELMNISKTGKTYWTWTSIEPVLDKKGIVVGYSAVSDDITAQKMLKRLSVTDPLTQLKNRLKLDAILEEEWQRFLRTKEQFVVIIIDLDHFKAINDSYGHNQGDQALVSAADIFKNRLRITDTIGRWGGEEFLAICPATDLQGGMALAEELRISLASAKINIREGLSASFGVAVAEPEIDNLESLIRIADSALYLAKDSGRNRVETIQTLD